MGVALRSKGSHPNSLAGSERKSIGSGFSFLHTWHLFFCESWKRHEGMARSEEGPRSWGAAEFAGLETTEEGSLACLLLAGRSQHTRSLPVMRLEGGLRM